MARESSSRKSALRPRKADKPQIADQAPDPIPAAPSSSDVPTIRSAPMVAMPNFKYPFADFDFSKMVGDFKFPMLDVETLVEAHRRNFQALTAANQTVFEAFKGIAQRQADMAKVAMDEFSKAGSEMISAGSIEEKTAKNADLMKKGYETAIANAKELTELYAKGSAEAFETISKRVTEALDEMKVVALKK